MNERNRSAVVLFSGGMDSAAALVLAMEGRKGQGYKRLTALLVDYGQPHRDAELFAAASIATTLEVPVSRISIADAMRALIPTSFTAGHLKSMTPGHHPSEIPGRNGILLSLAASNARVWYGEDEIDVWIGATADDAAGFPDCRLEFFQSAASTLRLALANDVIVVAPFARSVSMPSERGVTKRELVSAAVGRSDGGRMLQAIRRSWSCYRGGEKPCGECTPCVLRADAFAAANIADGDFSWRMIGGDPSREVRR